MLNIRPVTPTDLSYGETSHPANACGRTEICARQGKSISSQYPSNKNCSRRRLTQSLLVETYSSRKLTAVIEYVNRCRLPAAAAAATTLLLLLLLPLQLLLQTPTHANTYTVAHDRKEHLPLSHSHDTESKGHRDADRQPLRNCGDRQRHSNVEHFQKLLALRQTTSRHTRGRKDTKYAHIYYVH